MEKIQETSIRALPEALHTSNSNSSRTQSPIPPGLGRIVRDKTGTVVQVEMNEGVQHTVGGKATQIDMERSDPVIDANVLAKWTINKKATIERSDEQIHISNGECHFLLPVGSVRHENSSTI